MATALLYSDIKVGPDGWPTEDYDDLEHFHAPLVQDAVAQYSCIVCDAQITPVYDDEEHRTAAIADLHALRKRLGAEMEAIEDRLEKEAKE